MQSSWYHLTMTTPTEKSALLLFAHGSSDPGWAAPFVKLKATVQAREPDKVVALAFLERMEPSFDDAVMALHKQAVKQITVAPIFLAIGGHMRKDLPKLIEEAQARTGVSFNVLPALGEADVLITAIADWVLSSAK